MQASLRSGESITTPCRRSSSQFHAGLDVVSGAAVFVIMDISARLRGLDFNPSSLFFPRLTAMKADALHPPLSVVVAFRAAHRSANLRKPLLRSVAGVARADAKKRRRFHMPSSLSFVGSRS